MKQMIGVVIGASRDAIHIIKKAREKGIFVVAMDGNPEAEGMKYADKAINVDISDVEKVCSVVEQIKPDFIIPIPIGRYLTTTGYINDKFHLKGAKYLPTEWSTDKYKFHVKLNEGGMRNIQTHLLTGNSNIETLSKKYPVIIKPRFGSGSRDVFYVTNEEELVSAYEKIKNSNEDFVMEEAVAGEEYGVDGAIIDGHLVITLIRKKILTPLPIRQAIGSIAIEKGELFNQIEENIRKVVDLLEYDNCLLNADVIVNNNEIFLIEISPRPAGHNLHNVFIPVATGIDIAGEYINFLMGRPYQFEAEKIKCMQIRYFDLENMVVKRVPSLEELQENPTCNIVQWKCNIREGEFMGSVTDGHSIMGRGYFIVEGKNEQELMEQSEYVLSQFR